MNLLTLVKTFATILPLITDVVVAVEAANGVGNGKMKKELAIGVLKTLYEATKPEIPFDTLRNTIEVAIDSIVAIKNAAKEFAKSLKAA